MSMKGLSVFKKKRIHKTGVLLCMPSRDGYNRSEQVLRSAVNGALSVREDFGYTVEPYVLNNHYPICDARNECSQHLIEKTKHEYLAFWDHDMVPPENWLALVGQGDIVSGLTFMWRGGQKPLQRLQFNQFRIDENNMAGTLLPRIESEPYEVDIVGTAAMVIHRRVFEKLGPRPFKEPLGPDGKRFMGEDMAFCREARAAGFKVKIIPGVIFNHVKEVGLWEVYETIAAFSEMSYRAGYQKALQDAAAKAAPSEAPATLEAQVAQAGGAA